LTILHYKQLHDLGFHVLKSDHDRSGKKINCEENPDLNNNQRIKMDILHKVKQKFNKFGLNVIQRATKFRLKHNGTWVKL
jgi:hypothetical protein